MLYQASVPVFQRYLRHLGLWLEKAGAFANHQGLRPDDWLALRLAPDMLPLGRQVMTVAYFSLRAAYPLAGLEIPAQRDHPLTLDGLRACLAHTQGQLNLLAPEAFDASEHRVLESRAGEAVVRLPADAFLFQYALPNFFFHLSICYALLRQAGVPLGKADFDGFHIYPPVACATARDRMSPLQERSL